MSEIYKITISSQASGHTDRHTGSPYTYSHDILYMSEIYKITISHDRQNV